MIAASQVSDFLLTFARSHGDCLTNLKLQKLLYYCQGWHLAIHKKPLFHERIEAWAHGPVVKSEYRRFKKFTFNPITDSVSNAPLPPPAHELVQEVFEKYAPFTAWDLERMTHEELPWRSARGILAPDKNGSEEISIQSIGEYFGAILTKSSSRA